MGSVWHPAAAETERGAYVSGLSRIGWPQSIGSSARRRRVGRCPITPIVPVVPIAYTLFIVPALAAAIVARFDRVIVAVVAGLAIGMLGSWVGSMASQHSVLPSSGLPEMVLPF